MCPAAASARVTGGAAPEARETMWLWPWGVKQPAACAGGDPAAWRRAFDADLPGTVGFVDAALPCQWQSWTA